MKTIVTHDSSFHTDDVFAVAILLLKFPDSKVIRSRNMDVAAAADIVVDFGYVYDPQLGRFDHHQPGRAGKRKNGIDYASCGLVWKEFGEELAGGKREAERIDREIFQPVDAHDNGMAIAEYKFKGVREFTIGDFFSSYINQNDNSPDRLYEIFMQLVKIAQELLKREIIKAKQSVISEDVIRKIYEESKEKWLIELPDPEEMFPWREILIEYPEPLYVLYPRRDGKWGIKAVPDSTKPYGHNRKSFPEGWRGLSGMDLQKITGIEDAIFSHAAGFMTAASSREGALALAKLAYNA